MANSLLLRNISILAGTHPPGTVRLKGEQMRHLPCINNAYLLSENGVIADFGLQQDCRYEHADQIIDCTGRIVIPAFCDSHTHLVFGDWRHHEFVNRIEGMSYEEIAAKGGGILNSANRLANLDENELLERAEKNLKELITLGTGAMEIKSGYGLTVESELKILRVIRRLREKNIIPVKATFLGAHAFPLAYKNNRRGYIRLIIDEMLPVIADEGYADYIDVFCEKGFFTVDETDEILEAGIRRGLKAKVHANELGYSGGVQVGVKHRAVSVDHLEYTGEDELEFLQRSDTIATLLPSTAFFLGLPYAPAREMIDHGLTVALASDFNPGTSPSGNMSFTISLACIHMKMLPEEAVNSSTINGAAAMEVNHLAGSIERLKLANLAITRPMDSIAMVPYLFAHRNIEKVIISGKVF